MLGLSGPQTQQASQQLGVAPDQMSTALEAAVPLLLGQLTQNATNPMQAQSLASAVEQHDGSALDAFQSGQLPNMDDGQSIVRHVFGGQQDSAAYAVAQRAGINPQTAMQILAMVAPLVMAYLGRNRGGAGGNLGGLGSILSSVLGGGAMAGGLGSILGSVLGGGQSQPQYQQQQGGGDLGSILGGILGGAMGGQPAQQSYQNSDLSDLSSGVGLTPVGQPQTGQPQQQGGGIFGAVNDVLGGNHGALDDLIGMFGGKR